MHEMEPWLALLIAVLATWRMAHLVAHEDGPFDLVLRLRARAGESQWGRLMDCPYCLSLWFAMPAAAWLASRFASSSIDGLLFWLAVSGGACLAEKAALRLDAGATRRQES